MFVWNRLFIHSWFEHKILAQTWLVWVTFGILCMHMMNVYVQKEYPFKWKVLDLVKEVFNLKVELLHDVMLVEAKSNHMFEKVTCTCNFELFQLMIFLGQFCQFLIKKLKFFGQICFFKCWLKNICQISTSKNWIIKAWCPLFFFTISSILNIYLKFQTHR
jgi:hypothetical protein